MKDIDFFFQDGVFKLKYIVTLKSGLMFGELGILRNKPRAASIVVKSPTHLAVMEKEDYIKILKA